MSDKQYITIDCLLIRQPIGTFYIGGMRHEDLTYISFADIRRLETKSELREVEVYTGIQRELSTNRAKKIGKYTNLVDASFPTSVILHIDNKNISYNKSKKELKILYKDNVAKVLDGQHRIAGLDYYNGPSNGFDVNVTIFVEMELEDQAILFATVNQTQTKVSSSLVSDLFAFAKYRSPQKTAHTIIRALNLNDKSPFKDKIKILGTADDKEKETITQATFAKEIINLISKDPMHDRNEYKKGKKPKKYDDPKDRLRYPLRDLFIEEKDDVIAKIIWEYFSAIQEKWPKAWIPVENEMILNKSTGFIAFMKYFKIAYSQSIKVGQLVKRKYYKDLFSNTTLKEKDFNRTLFVPGGSGISLLKNRLLEETGLS